MKINYKNPEKRKAIFVWEADVNFISMQKSFGMKESNEDEIKKTAIKKYGNDCFVFPSSLRSESLLLWVSRIKEWESQKEVQTSYSLKERKSYVDNENENIIDIFDFSSNILGKKQLKIMFSLQSYEVEVEADSWDTKEYKKSSLFYIRNTRSGRQLGQTNSIKDEANQIIKEGGSYFSKAKMLYNWIIKNIAYEKTDTKRGAMRVFETKSGNEAEISFLYITMMRAVGIPARLVSGAWGQVEKKQDYHFWTEFYIEDVGWIPVDCAKKTFASIDNQRLIFSKGENIMLDMSPNNDKFFQIDNKRVFSMQPEALYLNKSESGFFALKTNKHLLVKGEKRY